jgi:alpha-galactosidase
MCGKLSLPEPYIHITLLMAALLDLIYVTSNLRDKWVGVETVVVALTDHLAVSLRIKLETSLLQRGRGLWKKNTKPLEYTITRSRFQQEWTRGRLLERKHPDMVTWWENYVKRKILYIFIQDATARTRVDVINDNFYYACI